MADLKKTADGTPEPPPPPAAGPDEEPGKPIRCLPESVTAATINTENRRYWKSWQ